MVKNYIRKQILRMSLIGFILSVLLFVGVGYFFYPTLGYFESLLKPSPPVTTYQQLQAEHAREMKRMISIKALELYNPEIGIYQDGKLQSAYVLLPVDGHLVPVLASVDFFEKNRSAKELVFKGIVRPLDSEFTGRIYTTKLGMKMNPAALAPFMIKCTGDYGYPMHPISGIIFAGLFLVLAVFHLVHIFFPKSNYTIRTLAKYGDPDLLMSRIDEELSQQPLAQMGSIVMTRSWLIRKGGITKVIAVPLEEIVWVHKLTTRRSRDGISMKFHELKVYTAKQGEYQLQVWKEADVDRVINRIQQQMPWVICGYHEGVEKDWKTDPDTFIREVLAKKQTGFNG